MKMQEGATSAIILNDNLEILLTKRSDSDDFLPGQWEFPGGGLEYGEEPEKGIKREIREECGIEIEVIRPITVGTYFMGEIHRIEICYLCKPISTEIVLSEEHSDYRWENIEKIKSLDLNSYIRKISDIVVRELSS